MSEDEKPGLYKVESCAQLEGEAALHVLGEAMPQLALEQSQPTLRDDDRSQSPAPCLPSEDKSNLLVIR